MSTMSELDSICEDAYKSAQMCIERGEKFEDVSEAVFSHIFNHIGQDPELRGWAINQSSRICARVLESKVDAEKLKQSAANLYQTLKDLMEALLFCDMGGEQSKWEEKLISKGYNEEVIELFRKARRAIAMAEGGDGSDI